MLTLGGVDGFSATIPTGRASYRLRVDGISKFRHTVFIDASDQQARGEFMDFKQHVSRCGDVKKTVKVSSRSTKPRRNFKGRRMQR